MLKVPESLRGSARHGDNICVRGWPMALILMVPLVVLTVYDPEVFLGWDYIKWLSLPLLACGLAELHHWGHMKNQGDGPDKPRGPVWWLVERTWLHKAHGIPFILWGLVLMMLPMAISAGFMTMRSRFDDELGGSWWFSVTLCGLLLVFLAYQSWTDPLGRRFAKRMRDRKRRMMEETKNPLGLG